MLADIFRAEVARVRTAERARIVGEIRQMADDISGTVETPSLRVAIRAIINEIADRVNLG